MIFRPLRLLQRQDEPLLNVRRILEKKVVQKLNFSKSVSDEKCASIMTRFNDFF